MLKEFYLDAACCENLEIPYFDATEKVTVCPGTVFGLRPDWDEKHRNTLAAFIMAETKMLLTPTERPGWFTIDNPPRARCYVTVDIEPVLLRQQRDLILEHTLGIDPDGEDTLMGVVNMLDHMLDLAEVGEGL
tara:strand:- start:114 stop:512 length:399 start_codon:yes stop_codon:yes gene_type:complete